MCVAHRQTVRRRQFDIRRYGLIVCAGLLGVVITSRLLADEPSTSPVRFLTEWGKQGTEPGEFDLPIGIAINSSDEVLITDFYNGRVQTFDLEGKFLGLFAVDPYPGGMAVDEDGTIYVTHFGAGRANEDRQPDKVTVHAPDGMLLRQWGRHGTGEGEFDEPGGLTIGPEGRVYVCDQTNRRVQVFDREGKFLFQWGKYGVEPGQFGGNTSPKSRVGGPQFVAVDSEGLIYTTEASVGRIQAFTPDGKFVRAWGDNEDKPGSFGGEFAGFKASLKGPIALCFDPQDRLWISAVSGRVQQFSKTGEFLRGFGEVQGTEPGQFYAPHGLALDRHGHLFVVDAYNRRIQKFAVNP
jgi:sugar lactone lactonase YvrE